MQVQRQVRAEPAKRGPWCRVNERRRPRRRRRVRVVRALGEVRRAVARRRQQHVANGARAEAGGVDERGGRDGGFVAAGAVAHGDAVAAASACAACASATSALVSAPASPFAAAFVSAPASTFAGFTFSLAAAAATTAAIAAAAIAVAAVSVATKRFNARHRRPERHVAAELLKVGLQARHEAVAVDDARARALEHAGGRAHVGLAPPRFGAAERARGQVAERARQRVHALARGPLGCRLRHNPLARLAVRNGAPGAVFVQHFAPADAQLRLERVAAVVEPGVDDL